MRNFIANGKRFASYDEVEKYAESLGLRISKTEVVKGMTICHLNK